MKKQAILLIAIWLLSLCPAALARNLTFFVTSDLHYGYETIIPDVNNLPQILAMNDLPGTDYPAQIGGSVDAPAFVLVSGDLTYHGTAPDSWSGTNGFIEQYGMNGTDGILDFPVYVCRGAEDVTNDISSCSNCISDYIKNNHGDLYYSFDNDTVHIISMDEPNSIALEWLADDLANMSDIDMPVIMLQHRPFTDADFNSIRETYMNTIYGYNVLTLFHGKGEVSSHSIYDDPYTDAQYDCFQSDTPHTPPNYFYVVNITDNMMTVIERNWSDNTWTEPYTIPVSVPPTGLEVLWKLDESSDFVANDTSGNEHHGTLYNDPIWQPTSGNFGGALDFDGADDYVEATGYKGVNGTKSRSTSFWINTTDTSGEIISWGKYSSGSDWNVSVFGGAIHLKYGIAFITSTATINDNLWHHVALVLTDDGSPDINETKIYIDGILDTPSAYIGRPVNTIGYADVKIGAGINAMIDDVTIFDIALTQQQVTQLHVAGGESFMGYCGKLDGVLINGDINRDCSVNILDLLKLAQYWVYHYDLADFGQLADNWMYTFNPGPLQTQQTFHSIATEDGYVWDFNQNGLGIGRDNNDTGPQALRLGDNEIGSFLQYRSILSFDTSVLPPDAEVVTANLTLTRGDIVGENPLGAWGGDCAIDIVNPYFSTSSLLENADYQTAADAYAVALLPADPNVVMNSTPFNEPGLSSININGKTQLRLYLTDPNYNNGTSDYVGFYSGESADPNYKPQLTVTYNTDSVPTVEFLSIGAEDGRIYDTAGSGTGTAANSSDSTNTALRLGDYYYQNNELTYRNILSFDTSPLPDNYEIISAKLEITRGGREGTDPLPWQDNYCVIDIANPYFAESPCTSCDQTLEASDFQAAANATYVAIFDYETDPGTGLTMLSTQFNNEGLSYINKTGRTQIKLYLTNSGNGNTANDYLGFYSGNAAESYRPKLIIKYIIE